MAPGVRAKIDRVVVGVTGEAVRRLRDPVPLLARDLARLAPDAQACVGEEAHPRLRLLAVDGRPGGGLRCQLATPARRLYSSTSSISAGPRGRRPGRMSQVATL